MRHHSITALAALACGVLAAPGCATRADLEQVRKGHMQARRIIADQSMAIDDLRRRLEMIHAAKDEAGPAAGEDPAWRGSVEARLANLERRAAAPTGLVPIDPAGAPPGASEPGRGPLPDPPVDPRAGVAAIPAEPAPAGDLAAALAREDEILRSPQVDPEYRAAIEGIRAGRCADAIPQLQSLVRKNIRSPFADKAQYWIGRCFQMQGDHNRAVRELYDVILKFPQSERVPAALLVLADAFAAAGDDIDARLALRKVVSEHPNAAEAEVARQRLRALGE